MSTATSTRLWTTFDDALFRTRSALSEQGFGVLTEIDVTSTLEHKLGVEFENYVILGACNPVLAHRALEIDRRVGLLLPCNIVVRDYPDQPGSVIVEAINPQLLVEVTGDPSLRDAAEEVERRLRSVIESVSR